MASINKKADAYGYDTTRGFSGWIYSGVDSANPDFLNYSAIAYLLELPGASAISSAGLTVEATAAGFYEAGVSFSDVNLTCVLYKGDTPGVTANELGRGTATGRFTQDTPATLRFTFSGLNVQNTDKLCFFLYRNGGENRVALIRPQTNASYSLPDLGLSIAPTSVYEGGSVTLTFSNRLGENVAVELWAGSTRLKSVTASGDTLSVSTASSWIPTGSTSVSVSARASDTLGRTATGSFTVQKYQASAATPQSPKSTTVSGTSPITFTWTVDESHGAQTKAEIQTSYDNTTWFAADVVNGSAKTYTYTANTFHAGAVYWRVRVTNSAGLVSPWSNSVSFTVSWPALSVSASPSTVYQGNNVTLTFGNRLSRSLTVRLTYENTVLATYSASADSLTLQAPASWFTKAGVTADTMRVTVTVSDDRDRTVTGQFTLSKFVPSAATPTAPKSTTVSGNAAIPFTWSVDESAAAQTKAELQWSTDNVNWSALATVNGSTKTWSAAAYRFRQGTVYWRARVTNAFGVTGDWSAAVSFTVSYPALSITAAPSTVNMGSAVRFEVTNRLSRSIDVTYKAGSTVLRTTTLNASGWTYTFPVQWFADAGATGSSLQVDVQIADDLGRTATVRVTMAKTPMTLSLSAASVYTGNKITATLGNTAGRTYDLVFKYGTIVLHSITGSGDGSRTVTCPDSWFSAASVTANTMRVDVTVTDDLNRTAAANFQLVRPQGSTFTPTAPKSTTADGAGEINFAWSVSSDWGTQTKAELQWSTDNAVWTDLATISGSGKTWTAPAVKFPAGTIYWRGRVTNSFGVLGSWSSSVNFTVAYSATSQTVPVNSPTSGIISGAIPETFSVELQASGPVHDPFTVASATFYWRAGTSGDYTSVAMTPNGSQATVTIPAGTFPSGAIQWYASAVDNTGAESETAVFSLTVRNAVVEAVPVSPISTVESGSGPIVFRWNYGSLDGSAQSAAQLQWSADGAAWTDLASVTGAATIWTAPADTFEAGTIYWRVRAANAAGTYGPWSEAVSFVSFAAPHVSGVRGTGVPYSTISWQTTGQLAYEVEIDGKAYGPYFGEDVRSFTSPEALTDGTHVVRVRAQNRYGLWSTWAAAEISVLNSQQTAFQIFARAEGEAARIYTSALAGAVPALYITPQPRDVHKTSGSVQFEAGFAQAFPNFASVIGQYQWELRFGSGAWAAMQNPQNISGSATRVLSPAISASQIPTVLQVRVRIWNDVGSVYSEPATYYYDNKLAPPADTTPSYPDTGYFLVYRDGKLIGKTYSSEFFDRFAVGAPTYKMRQVLPGGYYRDSDEVTLSPAIRPTAPAIALLSGGDFLTLRLSEMSQRAQSFRRQRQVAYIQYAGATFPEAEIGEHEQLSCSFDAAWLHDASEEAKTFEAMLGKPVILKTPGGELIVGVLDGYDRRDPRFYRAYSCTIQQMEWRDYIES